MTGREMLRLLQDAGWVVERIKGSHHRMTKGGKSVTVPVHGKQELPKGTEQSILKGAGLK